MRFVTNFVTWVASGEKVFKVRSQGCWHSIYWHSANVMSL